MWSIIQNAIRKLTVGSYPDEWQLLEPLLVNEAGWLEGSGVIHVPSHRTWFYPKLSTSTGDPEAIVAHCSDTSPGTAMTMANKRVKERTPADRAASWHLSIETETIVQMIPLEAGAWHASAAIPGFGSPNRKAIGIEMIGKPDRIWSPGQKANAARVWRAIVQSYNIPRKRAMIAHSSFQMSRKDPGDNFMLGVAPSVLAFAYA